MERYEIHIKGHGMLWNTCGKLWIPWWNHVKFMWNNMESMWKDVESMWNVMDSMLEWCGIHVEWCGIHVENHGFHGGMMWNPCGKMWNPCGNVWNPWGSMWNPWGNVWNGTIPPGIHLECGGRVNYWNAYASTYDHWAPMLTLPPFYCVRTPFFISIFIWCSPCFRSLMNIILYLTCITLYIRLPYRRVPNSFLLDRKSVV